MSGVSIPKLAVLCFFLFITPWVFGAANKGPKKDKSQPPGLAKKGDKSKKGTSPGQAKKAPGFSSTESPQSYDSTSKKKLTGWFRIHVVGTGKRCLVKEKDKTKSLTEQYGATTDTSTFLHFYGVPECKEGDKGNAKGKVRAWVIAEAYQKGEECVAKVMSQVIAETSTHKVHTDVTVGATGEATGDAFAICDDEPALT
eukprot:g7739.t1